MLTTNEARSKARDFARAAGQLSLAAAVLATWDEAKPNVTILDEVGLARRAVEDAWVAYRLEAAD